jgi:hypothetical protein
MSNISLEGNASGTGTFTIAAPNTSSNFTLTLPQASGTIALGTGLTGVTDSASPFETALGTGALQSNTTGIYNVAVGYDAANANTTGYSLAALGHEALKLNTTGKSNNAFGAFALASNTTGNDNVAVGNNALNANTTGSANTAVGHSALILNTTGSNNTAIGSGALDSNTTASNNTAIGSGALGANTTGGENIAIGERALKDCTTGIGNVVIGNVAGFVATTGDNNVCVGRGAGILLTTGSENVMIGRSAGEFTGPTTGSRNVLVGFDPRASTTGALYQIVLTSNSGTGKGDSTGFIDPAGGGVFQGNNSSSWSTTSDQRLKKNIVDNNEGLDVINQLRVRNFEYRTEEEVTDLPSHAVINKAGVQLGVIAQELQQVCPDCVTEQSTGVLSVDTDEIFWHMVNAIKQLNAKVTALEAQLATPPATPPAEPNA